MSKLIQELIGERAIEAFADFARSDIPTVSDLETSHFAHINDVGLRRALAQVFYGSRWIYKLGLVTLARNEERAAHVRAQIVDYASICEALLSHANGYAIDKGYMQGTAYQFSNPDERNPAKHKKIPWGRISTETNLRKQSFWWHARIAEEYGVIGGRDRKDLDWLREERNAVHVRQRVAIGATAYLNESKRGFEILNECLRRTKIWHAGHP